MSKQAVQIAAKLYQTRDTLQKLVTDYDEKIQPFCDELVTVAKERGVDPLMLGCQAGNRAVRNGDGASALWWLAAAVEVTEPSRKEES